MTQPEKGRDKTAPGNPDDSATKGQASRRVAILLLTRIVDDKRNLDALCDSGHGIHQFLALDDRDQALARAIAVTTLRNRNRIELTLKKLMNRPPPKNARLLIHTLHAAAAQILFMDVPDRAAVNIAVNIVGKDKRTARFKDLTNAVLRRMAREKEKLLELSADLSPLPGWLEKMLRTNYGKENLKQIASAASTSAAIDISVKQNSQSWAEKLGGKTLPTGSIRLETTKPIVELPGFEEGEWWVQDAAAALPALLVKAKPGSRVLELCAAPGGKTAQLANRGFDVTALDISTPRLERLKNNLARLNFKARTIEADILEWQPEEIFDAVLLDAPCSSTGTIRRHPDALWSKTREDVLDLAELQFQMICKSADFVSAGGCLVFSNCSMMKEEGENLLPRILQARPDLTLSPIEKDEVPGISDLINGQGALRSLPHYFPNSEKPELGGMDGFFACRFVKS